MGSMVMPMRLTGEQASHEVEMEGYLKKIRKLLQRNRRNYYKVIGTSMYIRTDKKGKEEWQNKYDLSLYTLSLSKKNKKEFYMNPNDKKLNLQVLRFIADTPE